MYLNQFLVATSKDARCGSARFHEGLCGPFGHSLGIAANHTTPNSAHHLPRIPNLFRSRPTHENWKNTIPDSSIKVHHMILSFGSRSQSIFHHFQGSSLGLEFPDAN